MRSLLLPLCALSIFSPIVPTPISAAAAAASAELQPALWQTPAWRIVGVAPASQPSGWLVPAGTQVIRNFDSAELEAGVAVTAQLEPVFSAISKECSTAELGNVALVFQQVDKVAQILVTKAGKIVGSLPVVGNNALGQPAQPIAVQLHYRPGTRDVFVEAGGESMSVPLVAADGLPHEFVLSTGAPAGLSVTGLSLRIGSVATVAAESAPPSGGESASPTTNDTAARNPVLDNARAKGSGLPAPATPEQSEAGTLTPAAAAALVPEEAANDQRLIWTATQQAAAGECAEAWKTISEGAAALSADRIGFRARSVAGFLRNMGRLAEAERIARLALSSEGTSPAKAKLGAERSAARYWRAALAAEILNDPEQALRMLQADERETEDPRAASLRARHQRRAETEHGK